MALSDKELKEIINRLDFWYAENKNDIDNVEIKFIHKALEELKIFYALWRIKKEGLQ